MSDSRGAAVVGSGPNGLAAAVTLARAGVPVTVFEANTAFGGGARTTEHVVAGIRHDLCSAVHPMALATGFFREFQLERRIDFAIPEASYAHPLDGGAVVAFRDLERTAQGLGRDGTAYSKMYRPLLARLEGVVDFALGGSMFRFPSDPLAALAVGLRTLEQGTALWNARFRDDPAKALLAGVAAHSIGTLPSLASAGVGNLLGALGHARGWPVPLGGSQAISDALIADLLAHGGRIELTHPISELGELSAFKVKLFDTSASGLLRIAGDAFPRLYKQQLNRFRFGDGAAKVDFVLDGPIPWDDPLVALTATVHLGGTRAEIAASEREVAKGRHPASPFVLVTQPESFDPGRNPGAHLAVSSYTHVPHGSTVDVTETVIAQIERFAPGFRDRLVAVKGTSAAELSRENRNYVGGDFSGGAVTLPQILARPIAAPDPWRTPAHGIYLCSSSAAPGPGVHGLPGWYAARSALKHEYGLAEPSLAPAAIS